MTVSLCSFLLLFSFAKYLSTNDCSFVINSSKAKMFFFLAQQLQAFIGACSYTKKAFHFELFFPQFHTLLIFTYFECW